MAAYGDLQWRSLGGHRHQTILRQDGNIEKEIEVDRLYFAEAARKYCKTGKVLEIAR